MTPISPTLPGLDRLARHEFPALSSKIRSSRVGLLTNHTGVTRDGRSALQVLQEAGANLTALFSPEHGPRGDGEGNIESGTQGGLPLYSLYGTSRQPSREMFGEIDILLCDLQDAGARFYTYFATIAHCLEAAAAWGKSVVVLDRPNPLGGTHTQGPDLELEQRGFVAYPRTPVVHGLTMAELARLHVSTEKLAVELDCCPMSNWERSRLWPETGLVWNRPSPNLPDFASVAWYPALCMLEFSDLCVGRGTEAPFQILGAPWLNATALAQYLEGTGLWPGLQCTTKEVVPAHATHAGNLCQALHLTHQNGTPPNAVELGLGLLCGIGEVHPEWREEKMSLALPLLGNRTVLELLKSGHIEAAIEVSRDQSAQFARWSRELHLYS